jgi:peptide/nickel transport system permease protein
MPNEVEVTKMVGKRRHAGARRADANGSTAMAVRRQSGPVLSFVGRRLVSAIALIIGVSFLSFVLISITPGDPAREIVGIQGTHADYERVRHQLGLEHSTLHQYLSWLASAVHGDLGVSLLNSQPVSEAIGQRLPVTLSLILASLFVSFTVGVVLGVFSAVRGGVFGYVADAFSLIGFALPAFWVGSLLIVFFSTQLQWFPATGYVNFADSPQLWFESLVLPVAALALGGVAAFAKLTRESMLSALASEHVRMARAAGASERSVVYRHALRNAAMPVITVIGVNFAALLGGTVYVETVFALPGLGGLVATSATKQDIPVIQGVVVVFTIIVVIVNLLTDLAYAWLDPRVRVGG